MTFDYTNSYELAAWLFPTLFLVGALAASVFFYLTRENWVANTSKGTESRWTLGGWLFNILIGDDREAAAEVMIMHIDTFKLVTVFLLAVSPDTLLNYNCSLPYPLSERMGAIYLEFREVPCKDSTYSNIDYPNFLLTFNITGLALEQFESLEQALCGTLYYGYFGTLLVLECLSLLYFIFNRKHIFHHSIVNALIFFVTSALFAVYPTRTRLLYNNDQNVCIVRYAPLVTAIVSLWYSVIGFTFALAAMGLSRRERGCPPSQVHVQEDDNEDTHFA
ncbi:uncharacterized protein MONBRDRAFT_38113 [Monosiga brevicollis MX1]|uniref:Uncharacterized protein n=1 Tax=Monosiga brevicollis TaxID=81824 RepID=A9V5S1_MONBE|nr:uncharacterized protein MONBRDRAFT_38113 [Monosiga brevicollis MX1]EDQ87165.1 predicted protein [Monosiga brevicollis MX1]|eukprot:XP_001748108.1 hypothetical protein [Monosiga brevicollis MX1]